MFLILEELKTVSTLSIIEKLTAGDDTIVNQIIVESISKMKGYLSKYYNADAIFAAEGDNRHQTVLKNLKDICIYEIYEKHTREQNRVAQRRYDEAMLWLEKLNTGEFFDKTLPPLTANDNTATESDDIRFGSGTKYKSNY